MANDILLSHSDTISITVSLAALPGAVAAFDKILLIDNKANSTLAGFGSEVTIGTHASKYVEIGALSEAQDANSTTAGSVGTALLAAITALFGHSRSPTTVGILAVDTAGGDNYSILSTLDDADHSDWYCAVPVTANLVTIADIAAAVAATSARKRIVISCTDDSDALANTATWEAAFVDGNGDPLPETTLDRVLMNYYNGSGGLNKMAAAVASWGLSYDPDSQSLPWNFPVPAIPKMAFPAGTTIATAKNNLRDNNISVALPLGGTDVWLDPGNSQSGRPFYSIVSADWFEARMREAMADLKVRYGSLGLKLPLNSDGQQIVLAQIEAIYNRGVNAGHFVARAQAEAQGSTVIIRAEPITSTDRANRRLRFTVQIPILLDGRLISISVTITQ